jgi:hypothetical protein
MATGIEASAMCIQPVEIGDKSYTYNILKTTEVAELTTPTGVYTCKGASYSKVNLADSTVTTALRKCGSLVFKQMLFMVPCTVEDMSGLGYDFRATYSTLQTQRQCIKNNKKKPLFSNYLIDKNKNEFKLSDYDKSSNTWTSECTISGIIETKKEIYTITNSGEKIMVTSIKTTPVKSIKPTAKPSL